jgi:hypothetical protein
MDNGDTDREPPLNKDGSSLFSFLLLFPWPRSTTIFFNTSTAGNNEWPTCWWWWCAWLPGAAINNVSASSSVLVD